MGLFVRQLAIDFGTSTTRVSLRGKGVAVQEPTILARDPETDETLAIGSAAQELVGRDSERAVTVSPLKQGVIADYDAASDILRAFVVRAAGRFHLTQPDAMITIPSGSTSTEQRALIDVGKNIGVKNVYLIPQTVAAALGAGLPVVEARGNMIINFGAGVTELGVMSLGGVVAQRSIRQGGNYLNEILARSIKRDYGVQIGMSTAEEIKRLIGSLSKDYKRTMTVRGRAQGNKPASKLKLKAQDLRPVFEIGLEKTLLSARTVLEKTPPDLVADIAERGITISGGGAYLHGLDEYLADKLQVKVTISQDPLLASVKGAMVALTHLTDYKRSLLGL